MGVFWADDIFPVCHDVIGMVFFAYVVGFNAGIDEGIDGFGVAEGGFA